MHNNRSLNIALVLCLLVSLFACEGEEESYDWRPGGTLHIVGSSRVPAGVNESFRVDGFTVDKSYNWTLDGSALEAVREGESVEVMFPEPGEYELTVSDGNLNDTLTITVEPITLSLNGNSASFSETSDTIAVPIGLSSAIESAVTVNYSVGGTAVAGVDYQLVSPNPLVVPKGTAEAAVRMVLADNMMVNDPAKTITLTISSISAAGTTEGVVLPDSVPLRTYTVTIADDLKYVAFAAPGTDTLRARTDAGAYTFNVLLSAATAVDVTVPYTVTGGTGVDDLTEGEVTFLAGQTEASIVVEIQPEAFDTNQTIIMTLGAIDSEDEEVGYETDAADAPVGTVKSVIIVAPE